jgi:hypothetical protein
VDISTDCACKLSPRPNSKKPPRKKPERTNIMSSPWAEKKASALKVLGDGGKLPTERTDIEGEIAKYKKASSAFKTALEGLEAKLTAALDASEAVYNAAKQYRLIVSRDNFGLDKDKDKEKIADAIQILVGKGLAPGMDEIDDVRNGLKKLDNDLTNFRPDDLKSI